jgi:hypothetical protein
MLVNYAAYMALFKDLDSITLIDGLGDRVPASLSFDECAMFILCFLTLFVFFFSIRHMCEVIVLSLSLLYLFCRLLSSLVSVTSVDWIHQRFVTTFLPPNAISHVYTLHLVNFKAQ